MSDNDNFYRKISELGVKLQENRMDYSHFTDDEKIFIATAVGFIFIEYSLSTAKAYVVYDTDREKYMAHTDSGWSTSIDEVIICDDVSEAYNYLLKPYIMDYFENIVIPTIPDDMRTIKSVAMILLNKLIEFNSNEIGNGIILQLMCGDWDNIMIGADNKLYYIDCDPNNIYRHFSELRKVKIFDVSEKLAEEMLYAVIPHNSHILFVNKDNIVRQLIYVDSFNIDAFDEYTDKLYELPIVHSLVDRLNSMNGKRDYDVKDMIEDVLKYD